MSILLLSHLTSHFRNSAERLLVLFYSVSGRNMVTAADRGGESLDTWRSDIVSCTHLHIHISRVLNVALPLLVVRYTDTGNRSALTVAHQT